MSSTLFKKVDSSDYITAKKQMAIANEFLKNQNTNPVKNNGIPSDKTFLLLQVNTLPVDEVDVTIIFVIPIDDT